MGSVQWETSCLSFIFWSEKKPGKVPFQSINYCYGVNTTKIAATRERGSRAAEPRPERRLSDQPSLGLLWANSSVR